MKNIETSIIIEAPASKVWSVLMDHDSYLNWNPFIKSITGNTTIGSNLVVKMQLDEKKKPMFFKPRVLVNNGINEFRWLGKLFINGIFNGEHYFILESMDNDSTKFIHGENFTGVLTSVILKKIGVDTKSAFEKMNKALKIESESDE